MLHGDGDSAESGRLDERVRPIASSFSTSERSTSVEYE